MTPTLLIIGWLACGVLIMIKAFKNTHAESDYWIDYYAAYDEQWINWRRKPDDQSREDV